ncbi:hypothetical protein [Desulfosarcina ovata]|uniref:DUF4412 domain-containing protein n=1 Tax=Desulfosarcina ovata subsp. ovata TaxID=2752305 RepID=A0A5K8ADX0_9BACT|nr:hypothetical protein [Desulfosarcina ovata]BBO90688.1 hypothetical protein DSCOOX_38680 [Desulfosarcina ovata subsp. ovata]
MRTFVYLLVFLFSSMPALAASFFADLVMTRDGKTETGKFFLSDRCYRMNLKEDGKPLIILVDRVENKTRVIDPSGKIYQEFPSTSFRSLMSNPFEAYQKMVADHGSKSLGQETVNGIECAKQAIEMDGKVVMTGWISLEFNFPVKLLNRANGYATELREIKKSSLNKALFAVPEGFVKQEQSKPQPAKKKKEKKAVITGKETHNAPIGRRLGAGGVLTIKVDPQKDIMLYLKNVHQGASHLTIDALNNKTSIAKKVLRNPSIRFAKRWDREEVNFTPSSSRVATRPSPDEIVVAVTQGAVSVTVNQETIPGVKNQRREKYVREPGKTEFRVKRRRTAVCRLVGDSQDLPGSKLTVAFFKDKDSAPALKEDFDLKNGQSRQWRFTPDQNIASGEVHVKKGAVRFYLEQVR